MEIERGFTRECLLGVEEVRYHGGCNDGWLSAYAAHYLINKYRGRQVDLVSMTYGAPIPPITRPTLFVDWCPPIEWLKTQDQVDLIGIIDHHQTAEPAIKYWQDRGGKVVFDVHHSAARLTWEQYYVNVNPDGVYCPWEVAYVEDRDLWRFQLDHSREINAYLATVPHTVAAWSAIALLSSERLPSLVLDAARGAYAAINEYVAKTAAQGFVATIDDIMMPIVNATYQHGSEVAEELMRVTGDHVAAYFFQRQDGKWQYGFRSAPHFDCSVIAKKYGGGGHKNAAGCQVDAPIHVHRSSDLSYGDNF